MKDNADEIWKFEKYDMIMEFHWKPSLPIPISVIPNLWRILIRVIHGVRSAFGKEATPGKTFRSDRSGSSQVHETILYVSMLFLWQFTPRMFKNDDVS